MVSIHNLYVIFIYLIWFVGVIENGMVILVIFRMKDMRTSTNIFLANLAIADFTFLLINVLTYVTNVLMDHYPSNGTCSAFNFSTMACLNASMLTVLAIGIERYYAICQPLMARYICTKNRAYQITLLAWILAALFNSPLLFISIYQNGSCDVRPYDEQDRMASFMTISFLTSFMVCFLLPLIILVVLFVKIVRHLNRAVASNVNMAAIRHQRQVTTMVAAVVIVFLICHMPWRVETILVSLANIKLIKLEKQTVDSINMIKMLLVFAHPAVNPILYNFMSENFRAGFKKIFFDILNGFNRWRRSLCCCEDTTNPRITVGDAHPV